MPTRAHAFTGRRFWFTAVFTSLAVLIAPLAASIAFSGGDVARARSSWHFNRKERCFMRKINRARRARGHRALDRDRQAGYVARRHARAMANHGYVFHDADIGRVITRWRRLGQNSGKGSGCRQLFRAFFRSAGHRRNILGRWRHMGVGVVRAGGRVYVQQVFEHRRDPGNIWRRP
jgi:cysteine-rich secretory family protein